MPSNKHLTRRRLFDLGADAFGSILMSTVASTFVLSVSGPFLSHSWTIACSHLNMCLQTVLVADHLYSPVSTATAAAASHSIDTFGTRKTNWNSAYVLADKYTEESCHEGLGIHH